MIRGLSDSVIEGIRTGLEAWANRPTRRVYCPTCGVWVEVVTSGAAVFHLTDSGVCVSDDLESPCGPRVVPADSLQRVGYCWECEDENARLYGLKNLCALCFNEEERNPF